VIRFGPDQISAARNCYEIRNDSLRSERIGRALGALTISACSSDGLQAPSRNANWCGGPLTEAFDAAEFCDGPACSKVSQTTGWSSAGLYRGIVARARVQWSKASLLRGRRAAGGERRQPRGSVGGAPFHRPSHSGQGRWAAGVIGPPGRHRLTWLAIRLVAAASWPRRERRWSMATKAKNGWVPCCRWRRAVRSANGALGPGPRHPGLAGCWLGACAL